MNSRLLIEAINFAKNHPQIEDILREKDSDPNLILIHVSCTKTLYEGTGNGYFLRVLFDYKIRNHRNTIGPDVFIDLEYENGQFRALPAL